MKIFVDSDVLIWHLRGDARATGLLRELKDRTGCELWTGAIQRAEILFHARSEEMGPTLRFLGMMRTAPVTASIVDDAARMFRKWHPSHGVDAADALLSATAARAGGKIITLNEKHFPMPEAAAERAWKD